MDGVACLYKSEIPVCVYVKYVEEFNDPTQLLVKDASMEVSSRNPFMKCLNYTSDGIEAKFDFTDPKQCRVCMPRAFATKMALPDLDDDGNPIPNADEPELKTRDIKAVKKYIDLILHPPNVKIVPCFF
jgi:hypothetical protein